MYNSKNYLSRWCSEDAGNLVPVVVEVLLLRVIERILSALPGAAATVPDEGQLLLGGRPTGGLLDVLGVVVQDDLGNLTGGRRIEHVLVAVARLGQTVGFLYHTGMDLKDAEGFAIVTDSRGFAVGLHSDQSIDQLVDVRGMGRNSHGDRG